MCDVRRCHEHVRSVLDTHSAELLAIYGHYSSYSSLIKSNNPEEKSTATNTNHTNNNDNNNNNNNTSDAATHRKSNPNNPSSPKKRVSHVPSNRLHLEQLQCLLTDIHLEKKITRHILNNFMTTVLTPVISLSDKIKDKSHKANRASSSSSSSASSLGVGEGSEKKRSSATPPKVRPLMPRVDEMGLSLEMFLELLLRMAEYLYPMEKNIVNRYVWTLSSCLNLSQAYIYIC